MLCLGPRKKRLPKKRLHPGWGVVVVVVVAVLLLLLL